MARKLKEVDEQTDLTEQADRNLLNTEQFYEATNGDSLYSKCGGALRGARENQGLTVHEIASSLRLSPKQIVAIEADHFATLPEPTIVRGFIRNYAKQLKIDAQPLLAAYMEIVPTAVPYEMAVKPTSGMRMSSQEKSKSGRYALAALALLLAVGVWLFYQHYVAKPSPTQPSASANSSDERVADQNSAGENTANVPVEAALPEAALPAAERAAEPAATGAQTATALTLPTLPTATLPAASLPVANPISNPAAAPAAINAAIPSTTLPSTTLPSTTLPSTIMPSTQAPVKSQLPNSQLTASTTLSASLNNAPIVSVDLVASMPIGVAKLEFNASQETWVNVVDANGREVYSKVIFAGSRESIEVKPPVNVTVGNAGGTSMSMNGKPVELAPHSRNNVAHIKLNN